MDAMWYNKRVNDTRGEGASVAAKEKKKGGFRRYIGWILVVWGAFLGIPAALCTVVTLFGGMEVDSFGEGAFLFFIFFVLTSFCLCMIVGGRQLIRGIAAKAKRKQSQTEPAPERRKQPDSPEPTRQHVGKEQKEPVHVEGTEVHFRSASYFGWQELHPSAQYEKCGVMTLTEKEPVITVFEDGVKTRAYRLQTEGEEDFTGKYFHYSVRVQILGKYLVPAMQLDGFLSDTEEERKMTAKDMGYRMEGHILACGGSRAQMVREMNRGQDLPPKGLKYPGYTTPSNIRLVGVCADCGESFAFHGYAFYMTQADAAYSDDGLDCCSITEYTIDQDTWSYEEDGKTFRYYNSFCCPHCGAPYIDYKKNPGMKQFGVSGCVHLGRKAYHAGSKTSA